MRKDGRKKIRAHHRTTTNAGFHLVIYFYASACNNDACIQAADRFVSHLGATKAWVPAAYVAAMAADTVMIESERGS